MKGTGIEIEVVHSGEAGCGNCSVCNAAGLMTVITVTSTFSSPRTGFSIRLCGQHRGELSALLEANAE